LLKEDSGLFCAIWLMILYIALSDGRKIVMSYTIGIDLGTTNMKACALSESGKVICEFSRASHVEQVPTGGEIDPLRLRADLIGMLRAVITEVHLCTDEELSGIGLTGMAEAGFLAAPDGSPLTRILLWYDQRGAEDAEELRPDYEDRLTAISGIRMSNVATIYKLHWLQKHNLTKGLGLRWFGVPEWAAWILTGRHYTDRTLAVRTGAYSLAEDTWSDEVLRIIDLNRELFPEIIDTRLKNVYISPEMAEALSVSDTVRVTIAGHDDMAAVYGAGLSLDRWVDSAGTAEGLVALVPSCPPPDRTVRQRMAVAPWYMDGKYALIAGVGTSGGLLAELHRDTGLDYRELDKLAAVHADYPENALRSELTPQRIPKVEFLPGLAAAEKAAAVYGRIVSSFRERAEQIMLFAAPPKRLVITGGQSLLPELCRRKAEVLGGIPTEARPKPEAAAYGAAMLANGKMRSIISGR